MRHWTESDIKRVLDGTFTRVFYDGRIVTETVEGDFAPYTPKVGRPKGYKADRPQLAWTPDEDAILCKMRLRNYRFEEIAWTIGRTLDGTKKRYQVLKVKGVVRV